ncbi:ferredoxin-type protein NapF [Glaesserella sp.]|uniref:ferredoxin-type protein NapF n=1 Tax=Glaesserella sp. TaxID=2094731 RepID=UPI0035A050B5
MAQFIDKNLPRRSFLRGHFLNALKSEQVKRQGYHAIRPPWADLANFSEKCTACQKCITQCETKILVSDANGYPEVNFSAGRGECTFCQACVNSCEAGVFRPITEPAWQHKIEIGDNCLTQSHIECRSCEDSCESRAIKFRRAVGGIALPILELDRCNGCGACLSVCPTQAIGIINDESICNKSNDG